MVSVPDAFSAETKGTAQKPPTPVKHTKAVEKDVAFEKALMEAYRHNPEWKSAIAHKEMVNESLAQAVSRWQPTVTARYSLSGGKADSDRTYPDEVTDPTSRSKLTNRTTTDNRTREDNISATVGMNLFDGLATTNGISAAEHNVAAARLELVASEQQFLQRVIEAYLSVWETRQRLVIAKKMENNLTSDLRAAQRKFEVGTGTRIEVAAAEAQRADAVYRRTSAQAALEAAIARFEAATRTKPEEAFSLPPLPKGLPESEEKFRRLAQMGNPGVHSALEKARASHDSVSVERGGLLPRVDVEFSVARSIGKQRDALKDNSTGGLPNFDTDSLSYRGGLSVSVPIIASSSSGGNVYSASRRASRAALEAEMAYQKGVFDLMAECVRIWNSFLAAKAQLEQSAAAVRSAEIAVDGVRLAAEHGMRSQTEVLYAEGKLLDSRNNAVEAQKNHVLMAYAMLSLIGQLTAKGLGLNVARYDVEEGENAARYALPFVLE